MSCQGIDVAEDGTVKLGTTVACDGHMSDVSIRVQSHAHTDHIRKLEVSKGYQDILLSPATFELLCLRSRKHQMDYSSRSNFIKLADGESYQSENVKVTLLSAGHMVGAVQVRVEDEESGIVGYSGDFSWPLPRVIQVDRLVIDATYGSPDRQRKYTQKDVEEPFCELIKKSLKTGPCFLRAHRGTAQRVLELLEKTGSDVPILADKLFIEESNVYRKYGYMIPDLHLNSSSIQCDEIKKSAKYIEVHYLNDPIPCFNAPETATHFNISCFATDLENPIIRRDQNNFTVAMTNHADFDGTIEFVRESGAKCVITDPARGGQAYVLASEIKRKLGINAFVGSLFDHPR